MDEENVDWSGYFLIFLIFSDYNQSDGSGIYIGRVSILQSMRKQKMFARKMLIDKSKPHSNPDKHICRKY